MGYLIGPQGAYSEVRVMPADVLIPLPDGVSDRTASTLMMKGMTAQYLFRQVYPAARAARPSCTTRPPVAAASSPASGRAPWA